MTNSPILWHVQDVHLNEAEFLFWSWENQIDAVSRGADTLDRPEMRMLAHIDGLRVGGEPVAERLLKPLLAEAPSPECVVVASLALLVDRYSESWLMEVGAEQHPSRSAILRALHLHERAEFDRDLGDWLSVSSSAVASLALELCAARSIPVSHEKLTRLCDGTTPCNASVARLLRHLHDDRARAWLRRLLEHPSEIVRREALDSALVTHMTEALDHARAWLQHQADEELWPHAARRIALVGGRDDHARLIAQLTDHARCPDILWALGCSGRLSAVDAAMELLDDDDLGPLAGEVVTAIVGGPEGRQFWHAPRITNLHTVLPSLADDDLGADLRPTMADELPVPNVQAIRDWWVQQRERMDPARRYRCGAVDGEASLVHALTHATMRRRHDHAFDLERTTRGHQHVDTHAWMFRQRRQIAALER